MLLSYTDTYSAISRTSQTIKVTGQLDLRVSHDQFFIIFSGVINLNYEIKTRKLHIFMKIFKTDKEKIVVLLEILFCFCFDSCLTSQ